MNLVANGGSSPQYPLDLEVDHMFRRLWLSGWTRDAAVIDARAACGAAWDMERGRHVFIGYTHAPRESI